MGSRGVLFGPLLMLSWCLLFSLFQAQLAFSQNSTCNSKDLNALRGFLGGIQSGIDGWSLNDSSDCCTLPGVFCDGAVSDRRVIELNLFNMSLKGSLSDSLANLDHLKTLNLSYNSLQGSAPIDLLHLPRLEVLDLSVNKLSGFIPLNTSLPLIRVFNISTNSFNGTHPILSGSRNLMEFDISSNSFWGGINATICNSSTQVQILRFSANGFSGKFPIGFGMCRSLRQLSIDMNEISGSLPDDLFEISWLTQLNLQGNNLQGVVSSRISNLSNLVQLDLSLNNFSGLIPDAIGNLRKLESFSVQSNRFNGTLPSSLSNLNTLRILNLRNNSLSGDISVISWLSSLTSLDLGTNLFTGSIPYNLSNCSELMTINLARNKLSSEIPASFMNLTRLASLSLSNNSFSNLSLALQVLQHCPNLTNLVLTKNFLRGETMPSDKIQGFEKMEVLVIANCALSGSIPSWLANCPKLKVLDISWNHLDGKIPPWIGDFDFLFYLDISNNSLTGEIPSSLTQMKSLISADALKQGATIQEFPFFSKRNSSAKGLQYNQVSSFPSSLILSNNKLVGPILPGFGELKQLLILDLHMNHLSGTIPEELSKMSNLETLDLSHNNLTGVIPSSFTKLNFLAKFRVAYNKLVGQIPSGGQFSTFSMADFVGNLGLCGFHFSPCSSETPAEPEASRKNKGAAIGMAIGIGIGTALLLTIIYLAVYRFRCRQQEDTAKVMADAEEQLESAGSSLVLLFQNKGQTELTINDILKSTNNFDQAHIIGCGGFGLVYKATFTDGRKVAIKRLSGDFCQMEREFQAEVETLSRAQHNNLVLLQGYCRVGNDRLLIYSYMENGSLDYWLHEKLEEGSTLNWAKRLQIAQGAARGLAYLHQSCEPRILHRDIKSSNILLDENFVAHLADFGLARLILPQDTHVSTDLVGTLGYIPPEYGQASVATYRGDVYSFGVVLLELLTGRRPVDMCKPKGCTDLIEWVFQMKKEKRETEVFDAHIYDTDYDAQMTKMLEIACLCVNQSPKLRPLTQQVVKWLDEIGTSE
ncbi:uncharacterized protein A4U43_UnF3620 [Asparagus officinalis]|uniref:non-specific serine/threonine protein kinase n=1 Tax=Asparagus officinalis TaxID=4686 RepID=A0A1R3L760_ASPOF|nr:phytosulfokine receptor 1-like [Asparagus officinalis]ONK55424.1 uncharacterized protein A4U43_UnF3620 [Asparagus officinalis]